MPLLLRLADDEGLERREIVRQAQEAGRQQPGVLELRGQELNGVGQLGRGQDLFVDVVEDLLGGEIGRQPLPQNAKKIRLLDVFFAVQNRRWRHA